MLIFFVCTLPPASSPCEPSQQNIKHNASKIIFRLPTPSLSDMNHRATTHIVLTIANDTDHLFAQYLTLPPAGWRQRTFKWRRALLNKPPQSRTGRMAVEMKILSFPLLPCCTGCENKSPSRMINLKTPPVFTPISLQTMCPQF